VPREFEQQYEFLGQIAGGSYGIVLKARNRHTSEIVAVKRFSFEDEDHDSVPPYVIREVSLLQSFEQHPNIVKLLNMHMGESEYFLVFEHMDMDLHKLLCRLERAGQQMPMEQVVKYGRMLLEGIHACHVRQVIHRDLKPQNILVSADGLKICDFGLARIFSPPLRPYTHDVITLWYRAPEILLGTSIYSSEVDMWSTGCCLAEMAVGRPLFQGESEIGTMFLIFALCGTPTEEIWKGVSSLEHWRATFPQWRPTGLAPLLEMRSELEGPGLDLLQGLLCLCPKERFTARRAKSHDFFTGVSS